MEKLIAQGIDLNAEFAERYREIPDLRLRPYIGQSPHGRRLRGLGTRA